MIRALILCVLVAGVGGAECRAPECRVIGCYDKETLKPKPCEGSIEEKIEKLEKRVAELEKKEFSHGKTNRVIVRIDVQRDGTEDNDTLELPSVETPRE